MKVIKPNEIMDSVLNYYERGVYPPHSTGYFTLDEYYKPRLGNTTIITGYPSMGKTEFTLQLLVNTTSLHGWKHLVFTPETGTSEEIVLELVHKFTGKTYRKNYENSISYKDLMTAVAYISDYFYIVEPHEVEGLTLDEWYNVANEYSGKVNTVTIDNWNDVTHDMGKHAGKVSEYLKFQLPKFNRFCKTKNVHGFILAHPKSPDKVKGEALKPARPEDIEGGSLWWAKGQSIIGIHRDLDTNNSPTQVLIYKAKPKIVGKMGMTQLYYHVADGCFSEDGTRSTYPKSNLKTDITPF